MISHTNNNSSILQPDAVADSTFEHHRLSEDEQRAQLIEVYFRMQEGVAEYEAQAEHFKHLVEAQLDKNKAIETDNS